MNPTSNFDIRKADSNLVRMLEALEKRNERFYKRLHKYCEDIDYYRDRGMSEDEAERYVRWWYQRK